MSVVHLSPTRLKALQERWIGQEDRLRRIAQSLLAGEDWTEHLRGLPHVHEVPPRGGEALGRDLRGADLSRHLVPLIDIRPATVGEAAIVAGVTLEAMRNNTPLPDVSPFPAEFEGAEQMAVAIRRGEVFLLARCGPKPVGVVRIAERREYEELTDGRSYAEISGLAVHPAWRKLGIGGRLLGAAEGFALDGGRDTALLRTTLELGLVPYYQRRGYETRLMRQMTYAGAPMFIDVVMVKGLAGGRRRPGASA
ncbi:MAG: GNAT family N-acetyltransferase [Planctomycetota bacterium]|nr:GNAT family N-acetyltransferase [Planctomycetota bacterium]